ncbi:MAG: hypothetical protein ROR55_08125 [Devosia sp.]
MARTRAVVAAASAGVPSVDGVCAFFVIASMGQALSHPFGRAMVGEGPSQRLAETFWNAGHSL